MDRELRIRQGEPMGARMRVVAAVVPAALLLVAGGAVAGGSPAPVEAADALVERPTCFQEAPDPGPVGAGDTVVHLVVPGRVTVRLDAAGAVVAAATNTGCAPKAGDQFVVEGAGPASAELAAATIAALGETGDWTEYGRFVPVR
jgi:hypothetical protein